MNTHESYVSLETAKMLKEAGFDWPVTHFYHSPDSSWENPLFEERNYWEADNFNNDGLEQLKGKKHERYISAPTLDVVAKWLREKAHYVISVEVDANYDYFHYNIDYFNPPVDGFWLVSKYDEYTIWEEAMEAAIKEALELYLDHIRKDIQQC